MKALLGRKFHVNGTWYKPAAYLLRFKSVVGAGYIDTTSSAGDWTGYFIQKFGPKSYKVAIFSQENLYHLAGFDVHLSDRWDKEYAQLPTHDEICLDLDELLYYDKMDAQ